MKLTVRQTVILAVLLGVVLPAALAGIVLSHSFYSNKLATEIALSLNKNANILSLGLRESLWTLDKGSANALIDAILLDPIVVSIEVRDAHQKVFAFRDLHERYQGRIHTIERPISFQGNPIGQMRLAISEAPLQNTLKKQLLPAAAILALQVLVSVLLILFTLQRRVGIPLQRIAREAELLAHGELDKPIPVLRQDEIGKVEQQLDLTRISLQNLIHSLEQKNRALEVELRTRIDMGNVLCDRETRLRSLIDQSPLAVIEFDLEWRILDWNDAAIRIFGWRHEEVLGRQVAFLLTEGGDISQCACFDLSLTQRQYQMSCLQSGQNPIVCQWHRSVIRDATGTAQRILIMVEDITERQRADKEIRKLASVLRLATNLVALINPQGRVEWGNQAFEASFPQVAVTLNPALGEVIQAKASFNPSAIADSINNAIAQKQALSGYEIPLDSDEPGKNRWFSLDLQPLPDDNDQVVQWMAVLIDITERRAIWEALQSMARIDVNMSLDSFFEYLVGTLVQGVGAQAAYLAIHHPDNFDIKVVLTKPDWPIHTGIFPFSDTPKRLTGQEGPFFVMHDANREILNDVALENCHNAEALLVQPIMDSNRHVLGHITLLFMRPPTNPKGIQSMVALGASRAATETLRHNTLLALQHSEQKFFSIFQSSPIALALLSHDAGLCIDINPAFISHFGYDRESIVGHRMIETSIYVDVSERAAVLGKLAKTGIVSKERMHLRTAAGEVRNCYIHASVIKSENDEWILAAIIDFTDLMEAQNQIRELNASLERRVVERTQDLAKSNTELERTLDHLQRTLDELVRSEKLAALGSLVAGIAHELNTPIGNSLLVSSTLHETTQAFRDKMSTGLRRSSLEEYIDETQVASDILMRNLGRAAELITSFKQVAVDQASSQRRQFDLAEVIDEIILTMSPLLRHSPYAFDNQVPVGIMLDSYPGPLGQVISNLLNNAIIHAFEGRKHGKVVLSALRDDLAYIQLRCSDNGVGIPAENIKRIFDPFFTTRRNQEGTGLGLNIVHNIVTGVLGGEIRVDSTPGYGTTFSLYLPDTAPLPVQANRGEGSIMIDHANVPLQQKSG